MGDGPSSNLGNLINNVFQVNSSAVDTIGSAVGAVADVGGAVQAAVAIADLFISQPDPLQPILDTLQKDFAQLYAALVARQNEEDWTNLAKLVSDSEAVLQTLDGLVNAQPPLTDAQRLDHIATCIAPLEALSDGSTHFPSPFFLAVYSEQVYWTDASQFLQAQFAMDNQGNYYQTPPDLDVGYGAQAPPAPPDNQVFSYLYVLPYYLKAVFILTVVGASLFTDFGKTAQRQQDAIILFANFLTTIHDLIAGGIIKLTPPASTTGFAISPLWDYAISAPYFSRVPGVTGDYDSNGTLIGAVFEWGAVEQYSGVNSISSNGSPAPLFPQGQIYQKLQVRALRELINVYANVGLPEVWNVINGLNKIAGQAPLPPHKYSAWSFREIFGQAGVGAQSDGLFHLSDMTNLIRNTPPLDTSQTGPASWRNLLEPT